MSLESEIAQVFQEKDWKWKMKGGRYETPSEDDVLAALDEAARMLYTEPVGTQLSVGRLIIVKKEIGHDVYLFAGPYQ